MISPESIDLATLPSVALCDRSALPTAPAIYFCLGAEGEVLYIGKTINLMQRWTAHHRYNQLKNIKNVRLSWLECSDISLLAEIEKSLIHWFDPPLNGLRAEKGSGKALRTGKAGRPKEDRTLFQARTARDTPEKIKQLAKIHGFLYNGDGSPGALLDAIASQEIILVPVKKVN